MWSHTHSIANTHILPPAHVDRHGQALSLDKRQRRRRASTGREEASRRGEVPHVLTPFLEPSLSNDGDIAHGSFTPSLMPLHACSTEREREEGRRGGEERKRGRGGEEWGAALPASASLSLPSFPVHPLVRAVSLSDTHAQTRGVCVCVSACVALLPVVAYLPASLPSSSSSPPPPPPPPPPLSFPLQTFLLTSSDSAWKEVKGEKRKNKEKEGMDLFFFSSSAVPALLSASPKPFHTIWQDKQLVRTNTPALPPPSSSFYHLHFLW